MSGVSASGLHISGGVRTWRIYSSVQSMGATTIHRWMQAGSNVVSGIDGEINCDCSDME